MSVYLLVALNDDNKFVALLRDGAVDGKSHTGRRSAIFPDL